jgi:omega-hydroxy-beta-dihydromenaquinone-9 sulfotransferase
MAWRETLVRNFGPGLLGGITAGDWLRLLRDQHFAVAPSCLPRAMAITFQSLQNSVCRRYENWRFGPKLNEITVQNPLFLLGHWRHGTTHLHNLMTVDERFAFANNYQVLYPHSFLSTEAIASRLMAPFLPKRRPMDNVEWNMQSPQEDEFALCVASGESPCLGWVFPQRQEHYDRFLTFQDVSEDEVLRWQAALLLFLQKLTWKYGRALVLKSPPHTCRIGLLLKMFPQAKFVHIHRNPYAVFPSTRRTIQVSIEMHRLQRARPDTLDERVLGQYRKMYKVYFEERKLIPEGNLVEIAFEDLEKDALGQMRRIYEVLSLPNFDVVEPALRRYVHSIEGYQKNSFPELTSAMRNRIAREWRRSFEEWGYPT